MSISVPYFALCPVPFRHTPRAFLPPKFYVFHSSFPPAEFGTSLGYKMRTINLKTILQSWYPFIIILLISLHFRAQLCCCKS